MILGRSLKKLKVTPQKVYPGIDSDKRGGRLDVFVEEEADGTENTGVYDDEPDKNDKAGEIAALPRRTRFYHALIDVQSLESGAHYGELKNVTVIVITSYDPFGRDRMVYTVQNGCVEEPDIPFNDGMKTLFLYIGGKKDHPPDELKQLLRFIGDTRPENAVNGTLQELRKMVDTVKKDREVSIRYMKIFEQEQKIREEGWEQGSNDRLKSQVRKKLAKNKSVETIAVELEEDDLNVIRALAAEIAAEDSDDKVSIMNETVKKVCK